MTLLFESGIIVFFAFSKNPMFRAPARVDNDFFENTFLWIQYRKGVVNAILCKFRLNYNISNWILRQFYV